LAHTQPQRLIELVPVLFARVLGNGTDTNCLLFTWHFVIKFNFLQEKAVEATKQKEEKRKNPKPEEQEGMQQHQHCPPEERR
jgi:phage regulator Rha-like protein